MFESSFSKESERFLPRVTIWEGLHQTYGHCGRASRWFNLIGSIEQGYEQAEWFCLVNGKEKISFVPCANLPRLVSKGDFNIEIDPDLFHPGINTLTLYYENQKVCDVSVDHVSVDAADEYSCDFTKLNRVNDAAQVVDGRWLCSTAGARCSPSGYDRIIATGGRDWKYYECRARFMIHSFSDVSETKSGPGVGWLLRWRGHHPDGQRPYHEWRPAGAVCWYRYGSDRVDAVRDYRLAIMAGRKGPSVYSELLAEDTSGYQLKPEVLYEIKACVLPGKALDVATYKLKAWPTGNPEPENWAIEGVGLPGEAECGSALFIAHHADVTIQTCTINRLND